MRYLFLRRIRNTRFDRPTFRQRLAVHLRRFGLAYALALAVALLLQVNFGLGLNATSSLPQHLFLIRKGERPLRGEYVAFRWSGGGPYPAGVTFIKVVAGVAGDVVTRRDRDFFVNRTYVGRAKPASRQGVPLEPGPTGVLPPGHYYVQAPHPDSLDSRYRLTGWITESQIIGRADAFF